MGKDDKEQQILDAAIKIFAEKGFSAATTSRIAKEAGVAEGTIFRYFKTKKDILRKILTKLVEILSKKFVIDRINSIFKEYEGKDLREVVKVIFKDRFSMLNEHWDMFLVILNEMQYHEDLRDIFMNRIILQAKDTVKPFFQKYIDSGKIKNIPSEVLLQTLIGMVLMYSIQRKYMPSLVDVGAEEHMDMMIDMIFDGIRL